jgi:hypothetical protein
MNLKGLSRLLLLAATAALFHGCDKASPVAPDGTTVTLTANPSQLTSPTGTSTITAIARKPGGIPVLRGTEIRFSTDIGTIDSVVAADDNGVAQATFHGDGRIGAAKITANTGSGATASAATVNVQVGQSSASKPTVLVSVNPSNVPVGGTAQVTVIGRNADGTLVGAGQTVILTTTLGTLRPVGSSGTGASSVTVSTQSDGTATAILAAGNQSGTADISAILGTSDAVKTTLTIRDAASAISITLTPDTVNDADTTVTVQVNVINSQGLPLDGVPVNFSQAPTGGDFDQTTVFTVAGAAITHLNLKADLLQAGGVIEVTAKVPGANGDFITKSATIHVRAS